jgi:predicted DNA-binding transcriptional regulator AlpA
MQSNKRRRRAKPQKQRRNAKPRKSETQLKRQRSIARFAGLAAQTSPHPLKLYRRGLLAALFGVDQCTIWRWRKNGTLPPPVEIGSVVGWTQEMIEPLLKQRPAAEATP